MTTTDRIKYLIIVGAGRIGNRVIDLATGDGHEVVVIEKNTDLAEQTSSNYDCLVINDDASKMDVLEEAGIEKADALITTTNDDSTNLLVMMLGRRYNVPRLLSSVREPGHIGLFDELDIDSVESPHRLNGEFLYKSMQRPGIKDFMRLDGGGEIVEIELAEHSSLIGKTILDALELEQISEDLIIVAIYRDGELIIPRGNTTFEGGDTVTVLSKEGIGKDIIQTFKA
ncbi:trk system potassium uptake protein TrkA [Fodinibius salinus]|uniref:Trk system potassium uptake protein TrkA n=1 Tax=Fodinibius salinus TaxID=860790 RepID=A0A5D3YJJ2_9BACT|nr:TrkA family potassium uptake protein [Fodinibius salinus]TYP93732.1 trk system potassium uptake protein TrkA [Fodinibius salinus]